jgi:hypothetical protein
LLLSFEAAWEQLVIVQLFEWVQVHALKVDGLVIAESVADLWVVLAELYPLEFLWESEMMFRMPP